MEWILLGGIGCGILSAVVGSNKGRSGFGWFLCGFFLGPFGFILSLVVSKKAASIEMRSIRDGGLKKCPLCAELIKIDAIRCRFCQTDLSAIAAAEKEEILNKERSAAKDKEQAAAEDRLINLIHKTYSKGDFNACRIHLEHLLELYPNSVYQKFASERLAELCNK